MAKVILTKKRLAALHHAISIDDILYRKHEKMMADLNKKIIDWNKKKQVQMVLMKKPNQQYVLQIIREIKTEDGIYLEVR